MPNNLDRDIEEFIAAGAVAAKPLTGPFTLAEKIFVIDGLIEGVRWARMRPELGEHITYATLKAIAADLRARHGESPNVTEVEIGRRIEAVRQAKCVNGNLDAAISSLGREVYSRWAVVRHALGRFGALAEVDR